MRLINWFNKLEGVQKMLAKERASARLKNDLTRAVAGVVIMLLGVGFTLLGWILSLSIIIRINPTGPYRFHIIMLPVALGWGVYLTGARVAGKSWAGVAASVGMGLAVLLVGSAMYVVGFTSDNRDQVLFLFWGTWLIGLGIASIALGTVRLS